MESLVFCKISCMKYYKGASRHDVPYNGGSFVKENGYGHEEYNFFARNIPDGWVDDSGSVTGGDYCLGFVETKSTNASKSNQLHVEKILGFGDRFKTEPCVTRVTVVFYNILSLSSDCTLLPQGTRHRHIWNVPSKKYTRAFGFGQSMLWYAQEEKAMPYLQRLTDNIRDYDGENWLYNYPE